MINMISGIKPNYSVYLIPIVLVQEGLDMIHPLTYRHSCPSGRMTVHPGWDGGWSNTHPNRPDQPPQTRDEARHNPQSRFKRNPREQQVQFNSASQIYHYDHNNGNSQSGSQSHGGPLGLSAYRVSQAPPNNGLWNSEQYHYTVLLREFTNL